MFGFRPSSSCDGPRGKSSCSLAPKQNKRRSHTGLRAKLWPVGPVELVGPVGMVGLVGLVGLVALPFAAATIPLAAKAQQMQPMATPGAASTNSSVATKAPSRDPNEFGVMQIITPQSSQGHAGSLVVNPALLTDLPGREIELQYLQNLRPSGPSSGVALYSSSQILPGLHLGLGVARQFEQRSIDRYGIRIRQNPHTQLSLSFALGDPSMLSIGATVQWHFGTEYKDKALPGVLLGGVLRGNNYFSLGSTLGLRPLARSYLDSKRYGYRRWDNELAIRPFGHAGFEVAGRAALDHRRKVESDGDVQIHQDWRFGARASLQYAGVGLDLQAQQGVLPAPWEYPNAPRQKGLERMEVGVQLRLSTQKAQWRAGMRYSAEHIDALALSARFGDAVGSGRRLFRPRGTVLRLDLSQIDGDKALIQTLEILRREKLAGPRNLLLEGELSDLGWAAAMELRIALKALQDQGSRIFAYLESADRKSYYIASVAEQIWAAPTADLSLYEPGSTKLYFGEALKRLSVRAQWLRTGPYKSAYESIAESEPSAAALTQIRRLYSIVEAESRRQIAASRVKWLKSATTDAAREKVYDLGPIFAQSPIAAPLARKLGLVDGVHFEDELPSLLEDTLQRSSVNIRELSSAYSARKESKHWSGSPYIGVVVVQGAIISGQSFSLPLLGRRFVGHKSVEEQLEALDDDPNCLGVILRVNSPGGSAVASDKLWRSVERWRHEFRSDKNKVRPIAVSMGDSAASGGYYLSVAADYIAAQPTTVTGSIGVTALHWDLSGLLQRYGVYPHYLGEDNAASPMTLYRPWSDQQRLALERNLHAAYDLFLNRVSAGRKMPVETVRELAGGRVWSGFDARGRQLIDSLGGYESAREWILQQLPRRYHKRGLPVRVVSQDDSLLSLAIDRFGRRLLQKMRGQSGAAQWPLGQRPGDLKWLERLLEGVRKEPAFNAIWSPLLLPQDQALNWSPEAELFGNPGSSSSGKTAR